MVFWIPCSILHLREEFGPADSGDPSGGKHAAGLRRGVSTTFEVLLQGRLLVIQSKDGKLQIVAEKEVKGCPYSIAAFQVNCNCSGRPTLSSHPLDGAERWFDSLLAAG